MLRETATLSKLVEEIKRHPSGVTQTILSNNLGLSQPSVSRSLRLLIKSNAVTFHKSPPGPNNLPGPTMYKLNTGWAGFDVPMRRECYGFDVTFGETTFNLEQPFQRLVTHKGANDYLTSVGNFRSALGNTLVFYIGQDILKETEPDWDAYRSALQLALSFVNTQSLNGSYDPESVDAINFRKAAGYYA